MALIICAIVCGILALVCLVISIMQFQEKGFLFNNAYIWASKEERKSMYKKPHYRQSAITFSIMSAAFFVTAIECILLIEWLWLIVGLLFAIVFVYAIISSIKNGDN